MERLRYGRNPQKQRIKSLCDNTQEEPLPAGGSCLLGSINLAEFVVGDTFDFEDFANTVNMATKALNIVLDEGLPMHPLEEQRESVSKWRQIGLGVMGIADMLIKLGLRYDSDDALNLCDRIGQIMAYNAIDESSHCSSFTSCYERFSYQEVTSTDFYEKNVSDPYMNSYIYANGLRNSQLLTIAPTGTISTMLGISGGIEPIFANSYKRKTQSLHGKDVYYTVYTPIVEEYMKSHGLTEEAQLPDFFVTSSTIDPMKRVEMQATWQKHIDASISSTINLPNEATVEDVEKLYMYAWEQGCKGLTIYRAGCKREAVLDVPNENKEETEPTIPTSIPRGVIMECSNDLIGKKRKLQTGCGSLHVMAWFDPDNGEMQEVYLSKGSTGGCNNYMIGLSRMISLLCRAGVDIYAIKDQLDSTGACPSYAVRSATKHDTSKGSCCPMAIGNALVEMCEEMKDELDTEEDYVVDETPSIESETILTSNPCPECGSELTYEGGCNICKNCGWSKCN